MAFKIINATEAKPGVTILVEGNPCTVKSQDISKTGKHGHAKARIEAVGILDGKKRVIVVPGHERFEVPHIEKRKAQVMTVSEGTASVMDLESYETLEIRTESGVEPKEEGQVEYWKIGEEKIIKRAL
jgi:translation initiation factor 5A